MAGQSATSIEDISQLAALAAQYGPFLFAILFVVCVPVLGEKWVAKILQTRNEGALGEREAIVRIYRFYWFSGIICGLFLTVVSVAWWLYVQVMHVLPQSDRQFERRVAEEFNRKVFQGVIRGADDNDIFIFDDKSNPHSEVYIYPIRNSYPMQVHFAVIFPDKPQPESPIRLDYLNKAAYEALKQGYKPAALEFCPNKGATTLSLIKADNADPRFSPTCGANQP
jgi:hypothetical protein